MGEMIISSDRDNSSPGAVNIYGRETAPAGARRNTELWHIPREFEPNRPLCGANLAGRFKRTKGLPNCGRCTSNASLGNIYPHHHPVLRALLLGEPIPPYLEKHHDHSPLCEADLIGDKGGKTVLTTRGRIAAHDIINPVGWFDTRTRLFHARRALELRTRCGLHCGGWSTPLSAFQELHRQAHKLGRTTITCVRCAVAPSHYVHTD